MVRQKMKIFLNFKDLKQLILDSYNGVENVSVEDESVEILLEVDGDKFHRLTGWNRVELEQTVQPIPIKTQAEKRKHTLGEDIDFDSLVKEKPLVDSGVHPPKKKTLEEENAEAIAKGIMTRGRGSDRALRKY